MEKPALRLDTLDIGTYLALRETLLTDVVPTIGDLPWESVWEVTSNVFADVIFLELAS